jgi:hypothetical protein
MYFIACCIALLAWFVRNGSLLPMVLMDTMAFIS